MINRYRLVVFLVGIILIGFSIFSNWTQSPKYNLIKIADYATGFSSHFNFAKILSIASLLLIMLLCLTAISAWSAKLAPILSLVLGVYCIGFTIYTAILIERLNLNRTLIPKAIGPHLAILGALFVLTYTYIEYKSKES